jgi:hypothetical protein
MVSLREEAFRDAIALGSKGKERTREHPPRLKGLPLRIDCDYRTISEADRIDPANGEREV